MLLRWPSLGATLAFLAGFAPLRPACAGDVPVVAAGQDAGKWSFAASSYYYLVPHDKDYFQPTLTADRDWFHFEARYNYEDLETGSAWLGWNFSGGEKVAWEFTPMIGGVFGSTRGVAPGGRLSLDWRKFSFYIESEYVVDAGASSDSYLYSWVELTYAPFEWLRAGLVAQRTRLYESGLDVDRGLLLGVSWKDLEFTTCLFNLGWETPTVVLGVTYRF